MVQGVPDSLLNNPVPRSPRRRGVPHQLLVGTGAPDVDAGNGLFARFNAAAAAVFVKVAANTFYHTPSAITSTIVSYWTDTTKYDNEILEDLVDDVDQLVNHFQNASPHIIDFLTSILEGGFADVLAKDPETYKKVMQGLMRHIVANLAKDEERGHFTVEELTVKVTYKLISLLGGIADEVDEKISQGEAISLELLQFAISPVLNAIIPEGSPLRGTLTRVNIEKVAASALLDQYKEWGKAPVKSQKPGAPVPDSVKGEFKKFGSFFLKSFVGYYLTQDLKFFKSLTKNPDFLQAEDDGEEGKVPYDDDGREPGEISKKASGVESLVQAIAPSILDELKNLIPNAIKDILDEEAIQALLLRALACMCADIFEDEIRLGRKVPIEEISERVLGYFTEKLQKASNEVHRNPELKNDIFTDLSAELLALFLPKETFIQNFINRRRDDLLGNIAARLAETCEPLSEALKSCDLLEKEEVKKYRDRLQTILGNPILVDQLYDLCLRFSAMSHSSLAGLLVEQAQEAVVLQNFRVPMISFIFQKSGFLKDRLKSAIAITTFKGLVHILEKAYENATLQERKPSDLFVGALKGIVKLGEFHLPEIFTRLQCNPELDIEKAITPLVDALIIHFYGSIEEQLPVPHIIRPMLGKLIHELIVTFFADFFKDTTSWMLKVPNMREEIQEMYGSDNPVKLADFVGKISGAGLAASFRDNMAVSSYSANIIEEFVGDPEGIPETKEIVKDMLLYLGHHQQSRWIKPLFTFLTGYVESLVLKFGIDFTKDISRKDTFREPNETSRLEEISFKILDVITKHFDAIGDAKPALKALDRRERGYWCFKRKKAKSPYHVWKETKILKEKFAQRNVLHPAAASKQSKEIMGQRMAGKITSVIDGSSLPLHQVLKGPLWRVFQGTIAPEIMVASMNALADEEKFNRMILALLIQVDAAQKKEQEDNTPRPWKNDAVQQKLDLQFSHLIKSVMDMEKTSLITVILQNKKLRMYFAKVLSEATRDQMRADGKPIDMLTILNMIMGSVNGALFSSNFDKNTQTFKYFTVDNIKRIVSVAEPDFSPLFLNDAHSKEVVEEALKAIKKRIPKRLKAVLEKVTTRNIKNAYKNLWDKWEKQIAAGIDHNFRKYSKKTKEGVRKVVTALAKALSFVIYAFLKLFYFLYLAIFKKVFVVPYFNHISHTRSKDLDLKIHDNLVYHVIDKTINFLKSGNPVEVNQPVVV